MEILTKRLWEFWKSWIQQNSFLLKRGS